MDVKGGASHRELFLLVWPRTRIEILFGTDVKSFCPASGKAASIGLHNIR